METKAIPITNETIIDDFSPNPMLQPAWLDLPEGKAFCIQALSLTALTAQYPDKGELFVMLVSVGCFDGKHLGTLNPMTPDQARHFAASLIQSANEIDGGANG